MENNFCLTRENLATICRLCLKFSKLSISIFDRKDPNPNKKSLKDRIYDMYSIKVKYYSQTNPKNILFIRNYAFYLKDL